MQRFAHIKSAVGAFAMMTAAACASLTPEPCTTDWVKWRTDAITSDFRNEFRPEINDLARFSSQLENPSPFTLLQMASRLQDFETMARRFSSSVMPELQSAIEQCNTPTKFISAFSGLLEEEGVDGKVLDWVESTALLLEANSTR